MSFSKKLIKSASLSLFLCSALYAQEVFTIENSSLQDAIKKVSKEANMTYMVDARLLKDKKAPNLKNIKGVKNVLRELLKNTNLEAVVKDNTIIIKKKEKSNNSNDLGNVEVIGDDKSKTISTYGLYDNSSSASSLDVAIKDIPSSIEVVNENVMRLRGDNSVLGAVSKTVGMSTSVDASVPGGRFNIRGFDGNAVTWLYNGVKIPGASNMSARPMDTANLERIEILRGANSILHGQGAVGASVNMITKQAKFTKQDTELDYSYGSFNTHRFHIGTGGELVDDVLAYRFDYSKRKGGSHIEKVDTELDRVSLNLLYAIDDNLYASFEVDKSKDETDNAYFGTPFVNGKLSEKLKGENYNNLKDNINEADSLWLRANLEWEPSASWDIKNQLYHYDSFREWKDVEQFTYDSSTDQVTRKWWTHFDHEHEVIGNSLKFLNKDSLFNLENRFAFGLDISKTDFKTKRHKHSGSDVVWADNPASKNFLDVSTGYKLDSREIDIKQYAVYMEDQLNITDNFKLVGGLRYDIVDSNWKYLGTAGQPTASKKHKEFSYRVGAVYDLTDLTTLYASYSTAAEPGSNFLLLKQSQTQLDLTKAKQFEIGLKQSFLDEKGEFTAALYHIEKKNLFVKDPSDTSNTINAGKQTSKGIELGLSVTPIEQFHIDANLAYVNAEFEDYFDPGKGVSYDGNQPRFVPKYVANLGLRYMPTQALSFGTWIRYVDSIYIDDANSSSLPSRTTVDLSCNYKFNEKLSFDFFVKNATDKFYATRTYSTTQAMVAEPRTYEFALNYKF